MTKKKVSFFIDSLGGGGAERVVSVLCKELVLRGYDVDILMLYKRAIAYHLPETVSVYYVEDMPITTTYGKISRKAFEIWNKFRFRIYIPILRKIGYRKYPKWNETSFYFYVKYALPYREYLKKNKECSTFGFLIRSNIAMLMAARGTGVKVVFCERNNPVRPDMPANIIRIRDKIYQTCRAAVFQTEEQQGYYTRLRCDSTVIPNPIKEELPKRYEGKRRHEIVNFCRINAQKNLKLLIDAFEVLLNDYPDYTLRIYGRGEEKENLQKYIYEKNLNQSVFLEDFASNIHEIIRDAAMFVSTSDYEGLSNSMLEALAIGLPCVCTDCDGGGARMIIQSEVNGLLVPKRDVQAVYSAMKRVVEEPELAEELSKNAIKIREELSVEKIVEKWEKLI